MKLLLTGATGYLGSHLLAFWVNAGHEIAILKRTFSDTARIAKQMGSVTCFDIERGLDAPFSAFGGFDAVIHTATCYGNEGESDAQVLDAVVAFPLRLLVEYAQRGGGLFINTGTWWGPEISPYSLAKNQFLEWLERYSTATSMQIINIRLQNMYGPGRRASTFASFVVRHCVNSSETLNLTEGAQKRDFIYIDDVIAAYDRILGLQKLQSGKPVNVDVGTGVSTSIREFVETVKRLSQSSVQLKFGALPTRDDEVMESVADIRCLESLGWRPSYDLESGLRETIAYESR